MSPISGTRQRLILSSGEDLVDLRQGPAEYLCRAEIMSIMTYY
jgi:hypothetical protein